MADIKKPTVKQQAHALIGHFLKRYEKMYKAKPPGFNRYALVYGFESLVQDYPLRAKEIVDFYFDNYKLHDPKTFIYTYGDVVEWMDEREKDARVRADLRRKTIERMKSVGTDSSQSDTSSNTE